MLPTDGEVHPALALRNALSNPETTAPPGGTGRKRWWVWPDRRYQREIADQRGIVTRAQDWRSSVRKSASAPSGRPHASHNASKLAP
jgi:hypothetical protein